MWNLGGLPPRELLKRTVRESWQDEVFGLAARLAFYHFIALFPVLWLLLMPLAHLAAAGSGMRHLLSGSFRQFLPHGPALLVTGVIEDLNANARSSGALLILATGSALWASVNASWAMIVGLNMAYETREDRPWWRIAKTAAGLAIAVLLLIFAALLTARYVGVPLERASPSGLLREIARWCAMAVTLLIAFALFYRFGPNLKRREWQWSTPGAVFGAALWVAATLAAREYFDRFSNYPRIYGRAAAAAMLLMWLYMTCAAILIGAEMNSEIEKAGESGAGQPARVPGPRGHR